MEWCVLHQQLFDVIDHNARVDMKKQKLKTVLFLLPQPNIHFPASSLGQKGFAKNKFQCFNGLQTNPIEC